MSATDRDPVAELTIAELDAGSRLLKADMMTAVSTDHPARSAALAVTAWLLARRTDRAAQLNTYRAMTLSELTTQLGLDDDVDEPAGVFVTDEQLAAAAGELGVPVVDLVTALAVDVEQPAVDDQVDDVVDEQPAEQLPATDAELLEADPTDPAPAP